jgi:hypothetical protein
MKCFHPFIADKVISVEVDYSLKKDLHIPLIESSLS